ncbi:MAG: [glutamine synthetase] adenylyltransferase / [glutamine synthetase]-adenylyl-L-tyrosine, partial [Frankiaceae bacterium]|nr:[glutamine synthetase] adenylyltransferase / [glutamine synthetase]-adenylyl-L-tyrosine [Frankiaceae bacterium]
MTGPERAQTLVTRLARSGFGSPREAATELENLGLVDDGVITALAAAADADLAATGLARLVEEARDRVALVDRLRTDETFRRRLSSVLGASAALGAHLARHPDDWHVLDDGLTASSRPSRLGLQATLRDAVRGRTGADARDALRRAYRRLLLVLAARDLAGGLAVD